MKHLDTHIISISAAVYDGEKNVKTKDEQNKKKRHNKGKTKIENTKWNSGHLSTKLNYYSNLMKAISDIDLDQTSHAICIRISVGMKNDLVGCSHATKAMDHILKCQPIDKSTVEDSSYDGDFFVSETIAREIDLVGSVANTSCIQ